VFRLVPTSQDARLFAIEIAQTGCLACSRWGAHGDDREGNQDRQHVNCTWLLERRLLLVLGMSIDLLSFPWREFDLAVADHSSPG
jgi:hypothetical protein